LPPRSASGRGARSRLPRPRHRLRQVLSGSESCIWLSSYSYKIFLSECNKLLMAALILPLVRNGVFLVRGCSIVGFVQCFARFRKSDSLARGPWVRPSLNSSVVIN
jgi:hypothetical protein